MCGRFTLASPAEILAALFEVQGLGDWDEPRYNIAPQTRVVTVGRLATKRAAQSLLWGAMHPKHSGPLINARSETVASSPLFARSFAASRVLIPADGFFEWTKSGDRRRGHYFTQPGGGPFAFAGIAVEPPGPTERGGACAVILTTRASDSIKGYHDRMPLMVPRNAFALWLDQGANLKAVGEVMSAGSETVWTSRPVGPHVNNVRNEGPECIREAQHPPETQHRLF